MSTLHLEKLLDATRDNPELHDWLQNGFNCWLYGGEDFDKALGLTGPGAVKARNEAIKKVGRLIDPDSSIQPWILAGRIEKNLVLFESGAWARIKRGEQVEIKSDFRKSLRNVFVICQARGVRPVLSKNAIYSIITS